MIRRLAACAAAPMLEALEPRQLLTGLLAGVPPLAPLEYPRIWFDTVGAPGAQYVPTVANDPASGTLTISAPLIFLEVSDTESHAILPIDSSADPSLGGVLQMRAHVDAAGTLQSVASDPNTLELVGGIDLNDDFVLEPDEPRGVLLTAAVKALGYDFTTPGQNGYYLNARLTPSPAPPGTTLLASDFAGKDVGLVAVLNGSTQPSFAAPFTRPVQGDLGPIQPTVVPANPSAVILGVVYHDQNDNGAVDAGEPGIATTVTLTGTDDRGNPVSQTTTSDATTGAYAFDNLPAGTYTVTETQPAGYLEGKQNPTDVIGNIILPSGGTSADNNFGEVLPASLSGVVHYDQNDNGADNSEPGIATTLTLTGTDDLGNPVSKTTTSNATTGAYNFTDLRPGTYQVTETQPAGYLEGKQNPSDVISSIVLTSGGASTDNNFGEVLPASLSGVVHYDQNDNGAANTGEPGIATTLTLTGTDDLGNPVSLTTTSDATTGAYSFTGLRPGTYTVTETQPAGYLEGKQNPSDVISNVVLPSGGTSTGNNFGEILPGSLSGFVYVDANNNGLKDTGETPIAGATLTLTGTNDLGAIATQTTTTAADGSYNFGDLRPGTYTVTETQPAGYLDGLDAKNNVVIAGSAVTDLVSAIAVTLGANSPNNDFGELAPASISGRKFRDRTGNGLSADDAPMGGITIQLTGANDLGAITPLTAVTASDGTYTFGNLRPGGYTVAEIVPAGAVQTGPAPTPYVPTYCVTLAQGGVAASKDFADFIPGPCINYISNIYYVINGTTTVTDLRGNVNAGDRVQVIFTVAGGAAMPPTYSLVSYTAPDATFIAANAPQQVVFEAVTQSFSTPGTYSMTVSVPNSYFQIDFVCGPVIDHLGPAGSNIFYSAQNRLISADNDGPAAPLPTVISGYVYADTNNDGVLGASELGIGSVTVTLSGTSSGGQAVSKTTQTLASGFYSFSGLPAGNYTITEANAAGYIDGKNTVGTIAGQTVGSLVGTTQIANISIAQNQVGVDYNFGEIKAPASITGTVYADYNFNGLYDVGESLLAGVTVKLYTAGPDGAFGTADDVLVATATTNSSGAYAFTGMAAGTYAVVEMQPNGYLDGKDAAGTLGGTVAAVPSDMISKIVVAAGANGTGYNFGEVVPSSIEGLVYVDCNNNGAVDLGEVGIANVTVTLTGTTTDGRAVSTTAKTDADGLYTFANLYPGAYKITETQPAGYTDGKDTLGTIDGVAVGAVANDVFSSVAITHGGSQGDNYNFGELKSGTTVSCGATATIGFWHNCNGQALIRKFNGSAAATALGNWLATKFPHMFGAQSANNMAGLTNTQIAAKYLSCQFFGTSGAKLNAQIISAAFAVYATDSTLAGGTMASSYGFKVVTGGTGAKTWNVGANGAAFGVANSSSWTVMQLLTKADTYYSGYFSGGSITSVGTMANTVFDGMNQTGDIK